MIPVINFNSNLTAKVRAYLSALQQQPFLGDIEFNSSQRLLMSTDNSVYQVLPQAVLFPKNAQDLQNIFKVAQHSTFKELSFSLRGGGTGTNGQSLSGGIIIDCSRHMNAIRTLDIAKQWVVVEPGVILDQLNRYLKAYGFFFPITISTSSRATLGGMANTNACGKGSCYYGRVSDNTVAIQAILSDGSTIESRVFSSEERQQLKTHSSRLAEIVRQVDQSVSEHQTEIKNLCPSLPRCVTGYTLAEVYDSARENFNLNAILVGSEGTLAAFSEIKLKICKIPAYKQLMVVPYTDFQAAIVDGTSFVALHPAAIETIDEKIINLARSDILFPQLERFITHPTEKVCGINLLEFVADNPDLLAQQKRQFEQHVNKNAFASRLSYLITDNPDEMDLLWELRKKSVGLLGKVNLKNRKSVSGVEDAIVPPEKLADFVVEFRRLLDKHHLTYGMFGHIDAGCLHVRPALDMSDANDEAIYFKLIDEVAQLTQRYGGVLWGEHGKGFRSQYVPEVFGPTLFAELCKIKKVFDPDNRLNPGKIAVPSGAAGQLTAIYAPKTRGNFDREIKPIFKEQFYQVMLCNGNGACFNDDSAMEMCPSYKVTRDRVHSPKGRASLMREWLRLLSVAEMSSMQKPQCSSKKDFSHEVYQSMHGCLGCRACVTQCPVQVDVPTFKAEFLALYHSRYPRKLRDKIIARSEKIAAYQSRWPRFFNFMLAYMGGNVLLKHLIGLTALPKLKMHAPVRALTKKDIASSSKKTVVLLQDWVTSFYEPTLVADCYHVLHKLGFDVALLPWFENGKSWHVKGYIERFKKIAEGNLKKLQTFAERGIALVGIDPSITLTYRQEYAHYFPAAKTAPVYLLQEYLTQHDFQWPLIPQPQQEIVLLMHCTEKSANTQLATAWQQVFAKFGLHLTIKSTGCCGMAGTYGHETEHQHYSRQLFQMSWMEHVRSDAILLATGYSCRTQIRRFTQQQVWHPLQFLARCRGFERETFK